MSTFALTDDGKTYIEFKREGRSDRLRGYLAPELDARFYDEFYADDSQDSSASALRPLREHQARQILARIEERRGRLRVLDVGCGGGVVVDVLNREGKILEAYGIEPAAPRETGTIFRCGLSDAADHPVVGEEPFDVVLLLDVLEHFEDPVSALREACTVLRPGGTVFIKVPNRRAWVYTVSKVSRWVAPPLARWSFRRLYQLDYAPPHHHYFDATSLKRVAQEAGLQVRSVAFMSEKPTRLLHRRLWGMPRLTRWAVFSALVMINAITVSERDDCVLMEVAGPD